MNPHPQITLASTALLVCLTHFPLALSILSFYPQLFESHPISHFFIVFAPWWLAYLSARWYIHLAEWSSPLYHPLGCLTQCGVWVFHWVVSLYHVCFVNKYTVWTYIITVFCAGIMFIAEGLFHSLIKVGFSDTVNLGIYEKVRKVYGRGLIIFVGLWFLVDGGPPKRQNWNRVRRPMQSRSMAM